MPGSNSWLTPRQTLPISIPIPEPWPDIFIPERDRGTFSGGNYFSGANLDVSRYRCPAATAWLGADTSRLVKMKL
jgi:hypothetical protein